MTGQLTLWDTVEVRPTSAMTAGEQRVDQCAWCGTIVVSPTGHQPHGCPCCDQHGEADPTWWAQSLPVAGIVRRPEEAAS